MARSEQFVAAAALPALLPTPPRSKMVPLLPTPCLIILPASFATPSQPKPSRADAVERWDAHKTGASAGTPPLTKRRAANRGRGDCRADACDRWDSNKTTNPSRSSASSSSSPSRSRSGSRSGSSNRSPALSSSSRASSSERWDIHKKPRLQAGALDGEKRSNAGMITIPATARAEFAGPSFISPEPSMLPLPKFLMAR